MVLNLAATDTEAANHLTAYPGTSNLNWPAGETASNLAVVLLTDNTALPNSSNVNFHAGQTVANAAAVPLCADDAIDLYNGGPASVDLIADLLAVIARKQKGQVTVFTSDVDDLEELVPDTIVVKKV